MNKLRQEVGGDHAHLLLYNRGELPVTLAQKAAMESQVPLETNSLSSHFFLLTCWLIWGMHKLQSIPQRKKTFFGGGGGTKLDEHYIDCR